MRLTIRLCCLLLLPLPLFATGWQDRPLFRAAVGPRFLGFHLQDHLDDPILSSTRTAFMYGVHASGMYRKPWKFFGQLEGWTATTGDHQTGTIDWRIRQYEGVGRLGVAMAFSPNRSFLFIPYTGYGWRGLQDRQTFRSATYSTYYVPAGLQVHLLFGQCWEINVLAEWSGAIRSNVEFTLLLLEQDLAQFGGGIRFPVHLRDAWLLEVPLIWKYPPCPIRGMKIDLSIVPFYQKVWYGRIPAGSPDVDLCDFGLPRRETQFFGARVEVGVRF